MKVLIVADNATTRYGGEARLPLHYFRYLLKRGIDVQLVVHERCKSELQQSLGNDMKKVHIIPDLAILRVLNVISKKLPARVAVLTSTALLLLVTQLLQRKLVKNLVRKQGIDVVHQPTPVSPKFPSLLFALGAPVIVGPMNGGMCFPKGYGNIQGYGEIILTAIARSAAHLVNLILPGKLFAAKLLVSNERTRNALPAFYLGSCETLVENGVDLTLFSPKTYQCAKSFNQDEPLKLLYLGRLVDWKGIDILIDTVAGFNRQIDVELHIVGEGIDRASLEIQVKNSKIEDITFFYGRVEQDQCPDLMSTMDALVLPSLFECGGACVLEAMSVGLPVIASKWGGPVDYLDEHCGILVDPTGGRVKFIQRLREAILQLVEKPELAQALGENARRKVEQQFDWEVKIDKIIDVYQEVMIKKSRNIKNAPEFVE
jgi:glycosyltransferase involved in cell wall biosynthesis